MVTQASTALREVAEMGKILDLEGSQAFRVFAITDDLSVQKSLIGLFLRHDHILLPLKESTPSPILGYNQLA